MKETKEQLQAKRDEFRLAKETGLPIPGTRASSNLFAGSKPKPKKREVVKRIDVIHDEEVDGLPLYRVHATCYIGDELIEAGDPYGYNYVPNYVTLPADYRPEWYLEPMNDEAKLLYLEVHKKQWDGIEPQYQMTDAELTKAMQMEKLGELASMINPNKGH